MEITQRKIPRGYELLTLLVALALVLGIGIFSYRAWNALDHQNAALQTSEQAVNETASLLSAIKDAETGQRGFLLTGKDEYLQPYSQAVSELPAVVTRLRQAVAADPEQAARVDSLRLLVDEKLGELRQTIEVRRAEGLDAAIAIVMSDRGKATMDRIRQTSSEIQKVVFRRLARESQDAKSSANLMGVVSTAGTSILFVFLLVSALNIERGTQRRLRLIEELQESHEQIREARDWLETTISSIGDAVIATDAAGVVRFLNPVAQELTGWSQKEAAGMPLEKLFAITNERTGETVENPVARALREGRIVGLANHTELTSKDGRKIPIEDSAAPIKGPRQESLGAVLVFRDVTERRTSEEALKRSEKRLKLALDSGQIGVWDWDIVQDRVEWSDRMHQIYGVEPGTFAGALADIVQLMHPDDRERISQAIGAALTHGATYDVEFRVIRQDGKTVWISTTAQVFRNEKSEPIRMLGATTDITQRKAADAHLREQWHTFDVALSNTPDFTYIFDLDGRFTYVNRALLTLWQRPLEDARGKNFFDLEYPADLAGQLQRQIQEVIETCAPVRDQTPFTGPTGETRQYEYIFVPVLDGNGKVAAVTGSTRDITERSTAEAALRISEERLTLALEAGGGVGTWDWDVPNDRVYCNAQFAKLFSIDAESATAGAPLDRFTNQIHSEDRHRVNENIGGALASGGGFADEFRVVQGDGSPRWVTARGRCHLDADGRPSRFPGVVFDITERKQAEEELSRSNLELTRVNRELEEFAYVASHDLQEPLRMVNIYTQLLLRDRGAEEAKLNQYADFIQLGVTRMETLIRDLLTFSRAVHADELPVGTADLSDSLREALTVMKSRIEESGSVIAAGPLPTVRGDVSQLAHVFQNLISNALKYRKKQFAPQIDITAEQRGDSWIITVSDNGIGFKQEHAERIFGLFKRLHNEEYPGTGLGLAICRRIVERYGGRIWAEGKPGEGATFRFSLRASA